MTPYSGQTVDRFLKAGRYLRNWSERTIETYQQSLSTLPDGPLTKARLDQWIITLRERGLTPGGINIRIRSVNSFLSWLHEEGELDQRLRVKLLKAPLRQADLVLAGFIRGTGLFEPIKLARRSNEDGDPVGYVSRWSPHTFGDAVEARDDERDTQLARAYKWLEVVKEEHETVDLWAAAREERNLIEGEIVDGDEEFSPLELQLLGERLDQFETQIKQLAPQATPEQHVHVHVIIEHAKEAATKNSKTDWKSLFVGKLLEIGAKLLLDPEKMRQLVHYATIYIGPLLTKVAGLLGGV